MASPELLPETLDVDPELVVVPLLPKPLNVDPELLAEVAPLPPELVAVPPVELVAVAPELVVIIAAASRGPALFDEDACPPHEMAAMQSEATG
jgi:hypothetical protein